MTRRDIVPYRSDLKEKARELRRRMTKAERLLWSCLRRKQVLGYDFDRQRPIVDYIVDFYCKELKLAIEIDGISHDGEEAKRRDRVRQGIMECHGIRFLRFSDDEVKQNPDGVVRTIEEWIRTHLASPTDEPTP